MVVELEPAEQFALDLRSYFQKNNLKMTAVSNWESQVTSLPSQ